ncbi:CHLM1 [Auxenochlorella protothecoides x Auxenochlorella symbiontica]
MHASICLKPTPLSRAFVPRGTAPRSRHCRPFRVMDDGSALLAVGGTAAVAAVSAALLAADPEKRRAVQTQEAGGNELEAVANYFNTQGFERWNRIYGTTDNVNKVQLDIREGHAVTVSKVLNWLGEASLHGVTIADIGCGTGSLAIPLALKGASVTASDISEAMAKEAEQRYKAASSEPGAKKPRKAPTFQAQDLESCSGCFDTVACIDVMIHYPQDKVNGMIKHLAGLADKRLIISFAPKTFFYTWLQRVGNLFPGPSKATRAYLHAEADIEAALASAGFKVTRKEMTATKFYFSRLFYAERL